MGKRISGYVSDELGSQIEAIADHHNVARNRVVEMLLQQGMSNWDTRVRILQLEAKLDLIVDNFAEEENAKDRMQEQMSEALELPLPDGAVIDDIAEEPYAAFQSLGIRPDEWSGPEGVQTGVENESDD
ncbi:MULTISPECIES: hypothetical protein [unclassified Haloarcula]|jgi:hypothetical protein|uniref:hypothetical protein n=1 Tax=Haloarcula sp. K1 TaxID=1622207 RepID=UPI0007BC0CC0|nr:hypothetical protein [Haloarcula sp. K1]KZX46235.1 hypothetical protein AV929_15800 [Haloarcula sp. K1]